MRLSGCAAFLIGVVVSVGCGQQIDPAAVEFRIAEEQPGDGLTEFVFSGWGHSRTFYLHPGTPLRGSEITRATVITMRDHPAVEAVFSEEGREVFSQLTGRNVGKHLAMLVDGKLVSAPLIRDRIASGRVIIDGDFSEEWAKELAAALTRK